MSCRNLLKKCCGYVSLTLVLTALPACGAAIDENAGLAHQSASSVKPLNDIKPSVANRDEAQPTHPVTSRQKDPHSSSSGPQSQNTHAVIDRSKDDVARQSSEVFAESKKVETASDEQTQQNIRKNMHSTVENDGADLNHAQTPSKNQVSQRPSSLKDEGCLNLSTNKINEQRAKQASCKKSGH